MSGGNGGRSAASSDSSSQAAAAASEDDDSDASHHGNAGVPFDFPTCSHGARSRRASAVRSAAVLQRSSPVRQRPLHVAVHIGSAASAGASPRDTTGHAAREDVETEAAGADDEEELTCRICLDEIAADELPARKALKLGCM